MPPATTSMPRRRVRAVDGVLVLGEGAVVDDGAHEVGQVGDVALRQAVGDVDEVALDLLPDRGRDVGARGGRALLALELEGAADHRGAQDGRVGAGVGEDEVLAAGLADEARVGAVAVEVGADLVPQVLERRRRAGEVDAGEVLVAQGGLADVDAVAGHQVDDARRHAGLLEQLHRQLGRELLRRARLPDDGVAHERRGGRQVAGDGGEVERRDRVDEALERAVVGAVPDALGVERRLLLEDLAGEVDVDAPEVDELARGVDLGLVGRLALAEHRRGVEAGAPRSGEQLGGLEQDGGAVVEGQLAPHRGGGLGGVDGRLALLDRGVAQRAEHLAVGVRLADGDLAAGADDALTVDRVRQLGLGRPQLGEGDLERGSLGRARRVVEHRLVGRCGHVGHGVHQVLLRLARGFAR